MSFNLKSNLSPLRQDVKTSLLNTDQRSYTNSPLEQQKLSPKGSKGKDWDHKDGRWESPAKNRGNDGEGTKKEGKKKYKINK